MSSPASPLATAASKSVRVRTTSGSSIPAASAAAEIRARSFVARPDGRACVEVAVEDQAPAAGVDRRADTGPLGEHLEHAFRIHALRAGERERLADQLDHREDEHVQRQLQRRGLAGRAGRVQARAERRQKLPHLVEVDVLAADERVERAELDLGHRAEERGHGRPAARLAHPFRERLGARDACRREVDHERCWLERSERRLVEHLGHDRLVRKEEHHDVGAAQGLGRRRRGPGAQPFRLRSRAVPDGEVMARGDEPRALPPIRSGPSPRSATVLDMSRGTFEDRDPVCKLGRSRRSARR